MAKSTLSSPSAVIKRIRGDAEKLVARGRSQVLKEVNVVRRKADLAVRDLERKVVRQFHAATEEQLKRLERRVAKLERALDSRDEKVANVG